jgi:hypothetical protein
MEFPGRILKGHRSRRCPFFYSHSHVSKSILARHRVSTGKIGSGPAPRSRCRYCTAPRPRGDIRFDTPARSSELKHGLPEERTGFDTGPVLAMTKSEMKMTPQLDDFAPGTDGSKARPETPSSETHGLYLVQPLVIVSAAAMEIGRLEESL